MTLDEYFHKIINQPRIVEIKELTMFERLKQLWTKPVEFVDSKPEDVKPYFKFEMHQDAWVDLNDEYVGPKTTTAVGFDDGVTWMEVLDHVLDVLTEQYGYDVKSQVYYSVWGPINEEGIEGYGRQLNDEVLQKLLLSHPEVYDFKGQA